MLIPLVHLFDVVVFTDVPVDVKGSFIMSMYVLGLCYMRFRTATCYVIDGFFFFFFFIIMVVVVAFSLTF